MTEKEMQTKITQAIGWAITFCTVMWEQRIQGGHMPTVEEMGDVVTAATLQAWKVIAEVIKEIEEDRNVG